MEKPTRLAMYGRWLVRPETKTIPKPGAINEVEKVDMRVVGDLIVERKSKR